MILPNCKPRLTHEIDKASELYPQALASIAFPPAVLYARGNLDLLSARPGVAIVGTRNASKSGLVVASRITQQMVDQGLTIVSGLALGIDAQVHRACLEVKGKTIAVLANGLHSVEPRQNYALANQILEQDGLWVSEHPEGTRTERHHFVMRNRIQVGLSACSIVVEANVEGGTVAHARFCTQEKRPLFAVSPQPGNPLGLKSSGAEMMVREMGAQPLVSKDDYKKVMACF